MDPELLVQRSSDSPLRTLACTLTFHGPALGSSPAFGLLVEVKSQNYRANCAHGLDARPPAAPKAVFLQ